MPSILIVALGNPGKQYAQTRHNVGWLVADQVRADWSMEKKWQAEIAVQTQTVWCKPQTFMNLSGQAVQAVAAFYKIPAGRIIVIYDDKDIPFGLIRTRASGSSGGHNGVQSIIDALGTNQFGRIRIGIKPQYPIEDTADFVLGHWSAQETAQLSDILSALTTIIDRCVDHLQGEDYEVMAEAFNRDVIVDNAYQLPQP